MQDANEQFRFKKYYITDFNTMEHISDQSISVGTVPRFYFKHHNDTIQASSGDWVCGLRQWQALFLKGGENDQS